MFLYSQISKLDVPCFPTYICDSCLEYMLVSYKFHIKCSKSNLKLQRIDKEHRNVGNVTYPETKHYWHRLCCSYFGNQSTENNGEYKNKINQENHKEDSSLNGECTVVKLALKYSLDNKHSLLKYLHLERSLCGQEEEVKKKGLQSIHYHEPEINLTSQQTENCKFEDELHRALSVHNGQLPKHLQIYFDHQYCRFGFKYICEICQHSFPEEYLLKPHIEMCHIFPYVTNSKISRFKCSECGKSFKKFIALREHLKYQHSWYKCKVCQKQFLSTGKFEVHVKKNHSGYRPFQCPICGKLFQTKLLFLDHEKYTHENEKPYRCKVCSKKWTKLINLNMHMKTHVGEGSLKCQDCDESFDDAESLDYHRKINHTMKRIVHECDLCLAEFTNLGNLTKHMRTHKEYKPHCCVICERRFPTLKHLKEHISLKHKQNEILMCELCHTTYLNENDLIDHIEQHA